MDFWKKMFAFFLVAVMLAGCGNSQNFSTENNSSEATDSTEPIKIESNGEVKISADGTVTSGGEVVSQSSLATGCDITIQEDGNVRIDTEEGTYAICKNYEVVIPAQIQEVVQVATPSGGVLETNGSGAPVGQMTVTGAGAVIMPQGTVSKENNKVVFTTGSGDYIITEAMSRAVSACQVQTPEGETLQVQDELSILNGKVKIYADGTVATEDGAVSMLEETVTVSTVDGVYTLQTQEVVVAEETTMVYETALVKPNGEVVDAASSDNIPIVDGKITLNASGTLVTTGGMVSMGTEHVTVTPLEEKTMTLVNGAVIDISQATVQEDGTVVFPEEVRTMPDGYINISPESQYTTDGYFKTFSYMIRVDMQDEQSADVGGYYYERVPQTDPGAKYLCVTTEDIAAGVMTKCEYYQLTDNALIEEDTSEMIWELDETGFPYRCTTRYLDGRYGIAEFDQYGQTVMEVYYDAEGNCTQNMMRYTYYPPTEDASGWIASIRMYNEAEVLVTLEEYTKEGQITCRMQYYDDGTLKEESKFVNGDFVYSYQGNEDGSWYRIVIHEDGTATHTYTNAAGGYSSEKRDNQERVIRSQYFQADGSSTGYSETVYNVDGWEYMIRNHQFGSNVFVTQFGEIEGKVNRSEYYHSATKDMQIDYNEDGSVFRKYVTDYASEYSYIYDGAGNLISSGSLTQN